MMGKPLVFASMVTILSALAALPVACGGSDTTIGGDAPDATGGTDGPVNGNDGASGTDTGSGNDGATGGDSAVPDGGRRRDAGNDSGGNDAAGNDGGPTDAAVDAPLYDGGPLNGCTPGNYTDRTNGGQVQRTITFPVGVPGNFTYSVPCMRIKAGQTVQFDGNFANHPLTPGGGTVPTPMTLTNSGLTQQFTFPTGGTYGYHCGVHATMVGSIEVVN